jgi:hypothetical protein
MGHGTRAGDAVNAPDVISGLFGAVLFGIAAGLAIAGIIAVYWSHK